MSPGGAAGGGAAGGTLASLVVQFVTKGQEELKKSLDDVQTAIGAVVLSIQKMNTQTVAALEVSKQKTKEVSEQVNKLTESFQKAGTVINLALGAGVGIIANFVRQGMAAGVMGQLFGYTMERLSLTISGLFRPEIQKVLELVNRLTTWLQNLTDAQRQQIAYWVQGAAAALAVGIVLPRIVAGITSIIVATKALGVAIAGAEAMTGIGAIIPILGLMAQALTAFLVGTKEGRAILSSFWEVLKNLADAAKKLSDALHLSDVFNLLVEGTARMIDMFARWTEVIAGLVKGLAETVGMMRDLNEEQRKSALQGFKEGFFEALFGPKPKREEKKRDPDAHRTGGFEDLNTTYQRIAVAAMRASAGVTSPEERTARNTEQLVQRVEAVERAVNGIQRPFAP